MGWMAKALAMQRAEPAWCHDARERDRLEVRLIWLDERIAEQEPGSPRRRLLHRRRAVVYEAYLEACTASQGGGWE